MEMHQIRYFLAVADSLNFTRAAERYNVTQPALSRAIKQLEDEVGGLLLRRERGSTHLTDIGRIMRPFFEQMLADAETAKKTAKDHLKLAKAPLRLGVMCTVGPLRFTPFLAKFRMDHPGVELLVSEGVPDRLGELLEKGILEVAVMAQPTPFHERFDTHVLYRERFALAMPPGHRLAERREVALKDMAGERYVDRVNCEFGSFIGALMDTQGVSVRVVYQSDREEWVQMMIVSGAGVACLPEYSPLMPGLDTRPIVEPEVVREICLVTMAGRRFAPAAAAFVKAIRAYDWAI